MSMDYRQRFKKNAGDRPQSNFYRAFNVALSFGLSLAISLFIMIKVGSWIDAHFQTAPYGMFACVLIAIVAGFRTLYREVLRLEEEDMQKDGEK